MSVTQFSLAEDYSSSALQRITKLRFYQTLSDTLTLWLSLFFASLLVLVSVWEWKEGIIERQKDTV